MPPAERRDLLILAVLTSCKDGEEFVCVQRIVLPSHSLNLFCQEQLPGWGLCTSSAMVYGHKVIHLIVDAKISCVAETDSA